MSARLGNKFITSPSTDERPCIYIYLVDDCHFHTISNITGFFSSRYFCPTCLKHYDHKERHECEVTCIVCKTTNCPKTESPVTCDQCHMTCRSTKCYKEHKKVPLHEKGPKKGQVRGPSECDKWWKCPTCYKVINTTKREKKDHRCGEYLCTSCDKYVLRDHLCYLRSIPAKQEFIPKFIFPDFECSQDERSECTEGYAPLMNPDCTECQPSRTCTPCSKCQRCKTSWCGKATHKPNFLVAHTVCPTCIDRPVTSESRCQDCGTRCSRCEDVDVPCTGTACGLREVVFQGQDTARTFGKWLFSSQHKYFKTVCHNMKFRETYRNDPELRHYLQNLDITDRLDPRESFFGGRTNASQLYYRTKEDEKIEYVDFTSLYPWVNKTCKYPVGHPEVITSDFKEIDQYFGIAKVRILPPRGLYHPVLPYKSNGKLKFPLCKTCAEKESPSLCGCSDEDRIMTGTWCTP